VLLVLVELELLLLAGVGVEVAAMVGEVLTVLPSGEGIGDISSLRLRLHLGCTPTGSSFFTFFPPFSIFSIERIRACSFRCSLDGLSVGGVYGLSVLSSIFTPELLRRL
jgi:hypothetical protein